MNINEITIGQVKELLEIFGQHFGLPAQAQAAVSAPHPMIGEKVIIRTFSAGVWFGVLEQKDGKEVILTNARRMWRWWAAQSISLSAVAIHGIKQEESKIVEPVNNVWLEAIEIIPCTAKAIKSIESSLYVKAE